MAEDERRRLAGELSDLADRLVDDDLDAQRLNELGHDVRVIADAIYDLARREGREAP